MKIKLFTLLFVLTTITFQAQIMTPQPSPTTKVEQKVGLTDITLEYSRPSMRGRTIFGDLVPFGEKWRTGANANSKITFGDDVMIDGKTLTKGTYAIYTIPQKDAWDIIFYSDTSNWGLPQEWDESKVALMTNVKTMEVPLKESFTMEFGDLSSPNGSDLRILWEKTGVSLPIVVPTDEIAMESIKATMAGEPKANDYFSAGSYYHHSGKDLNQSLIWVSKAAEMSPDAFWMLREKSLIQAEMGDKKGAIASAKQSLEVATKAGNKDYMKMNEESIAEWSK
jgi:hypothetical protein